MRRLVVGPAFSQVVFGKAHRYGTGANGTAPRR